MNEVTKIHLGRQAFTISVDAHHELRSYLDAIKKQVEDKDVVDEIELRMAELLAEHGLNANKVILPGDVDFLKEQLGNPNDFKDDEDGIHSASDKPADSKRLFRDTENGMIAGVAAGLAQYFGVDVLLIRILFVIAVFVTFGWGILLYIVLWLLVPEAKTSSERLQMAGKPVNVDSLKEIVERADIKGAAHRANASLVGPINTLFRFILKLVGLFFVLSGLSVLFGLIAAEIYILVNRVAWAQYNIFPVGLREHLLLDIAMAVAGLIALFLVFFGIAMFRRKWPIRSWVTGILVGLIFIGLAIGGALAGSVNTNIRDRYNANVHTSIRTLTPFTALNITGPVDDINYQYSNTYSVSLSYYGHPDLAEVKTIVQNKTLNIDSTQFNWRRNCQVICIPDSYNLNITIYAPDAYQLANQLGSVPIKPPVPYSLPSNIKVVHDSVRVF
jgi:phage shock protein PspC (stress-responsive transcriptional regulator)